VVLRPVKISNSPEVTRRLGVLAINTALEIANYGHANSTHLWNRDIMKGIGGYGDFVRNAALSFMVTPSMSKGGKISRIMPLGSHVDNSEHSVDIVVTEQGLLDILELTPRQTAKNYHQDLRRSVLPRTALGLLSACTQAGWIRAHTLGRSLQLSLALPTHRQHNSPHRKSEKTRSKAGALTVQVEVGCTLAVINAALGRQRDSACC
jgi:hypothetical protein